MTSGVTLNSLKGGRITTIISGILGSSIRQVGKNENSVKQFCHTAQLNKEQAASFFQLHHYSEE